MEPEALLVVLLVAGLIIFMVCVALLRWVLRINERVELLKDIREQLVKPNATKPKPLGSAYENLKQ